LRKKGCIRSPEKDAIHQRKEKTFAARQRKVLKKRAAGDDLLACRKKPKYRKESIHELET